MARKASWLPVARTPLVCAFSVLAVMVAALASPPPAGAEVPYLPIPDWLSLEDDQYGTGCDIADVNADGWLDLAVSNGNDIIQAPNFVYYNQEGALPLAAGWISDDARYSGHCELADLDGDGRPELMVCNYIGPNWTNAQVQIYANGPAGLETTPSWESNPPLHSFRGDFGDPDGDGDLDLAVATGESYNDVLQPNYIYFNVGGELQRNPGWISDDVDASYDAHFVDIDNDGDQDLALLTSGGPVKIYYNDNGALATTPGWESDDIEYGNSFDFGDIDGDGWQDLAVAYNYQEGGEGHFAVYYSDAGTLSPIPDWESAVSGFGSAANLVDVDADNDLDLVTGQWWGRVTVYLNDGGVYGTSPDWLSDLDYASVVENIAFADLDEGASEELSMGVVWAEGETGPRLIELQRRHLQEVTNVAVDGVDLPDTAWCYSGEHGWVSLGVTAQDVIVIDFRVSDAVDMAVSNWDGATYVFHNNGSVAVPQPDAAPALVARHGAWPNPFNPRVTVAFTLTATADVSLDVYDLRGRRLATLAAGELAAGTHQRSWDASGLPSGTYAYRLIAAGRFYAGKLQLVR
jgi:hypothetical protein